MKCRDPQSAGKWYRKYLHPCEQVSKNDDTYGTWTWNIKWIGKEPEDRPDGKDQGDVEYVDEGDIRECFSSINLSIECPNKKVLLYVTIKNTLEREPVYLTGIKAMDFWRHAIVTFLPTTPNLYKMFVPP